MPLIINDQNYRDHVRTWEDRGKLTGCQPEPDFPLPSATPFSEVIKVRPKAERKALIKARQNSQLSDLIERVGLPSFDQDGSNYCWAFAGTLAANATTIASTNSLIEYAAESVAIPVTGGQNRGGTLTEALDWIRDKGVAERRFIPPLAEPAAGFRDRRRRRRVSPGFSTRNFAEGWQANALENRIDEYYPVTGGDVWGQVMTGLAEGGWAFMVGLYWWGHAVAYLDAALGDDDEELVKFRNSWGSDYGENGFGYFTEGRGTPETGWGIYAVRTMLLPDSIEWLNQLVKEKVQ